MNQRLQRYSGIVLLVLALLSVGQGVYFTYQNRQITSCQADYNQQFAAQLAARSEISESDRESLAELFDTWLTKDPKNARQALEDYIKTKERNDEQRKKHPLPELPTTAQC